MDTYREKLGYLLFFLLSAAFGFQTFRLFVYLFTSSEFGIFLSILNSVFLLMIWFFSFTSKHPFIQENFYSILLLPFIILQLNNLFIAWFRQMLSLDFISFIFWSTGLVYFSHITAVYGSNIKGESSTEKRSENNRFGPPSSSVKEPF